MSKIDLTQLLLPIFGALAALIPHITEKIFELCKRRQKLVIGMVGRVRFTSDLLVTIKQFSNKTKALMCKDPVVILCFDRMSQALKECDFVISNSKDPKVLEERELEDIVRDYLG